MLKMTAEEWHALAAESLAKENKKIFEHMLDKLAEQEKNARDNSFRDHAALSVLQGILAGGQKSADIVAHNVVLAYKYADSILEYKDLQ